VVTGASAGIGAALAHKLAARGHALTLVARRREILEQLAAQLHREHGVEAQVLVCDLAQREQREWLCEQLRWQQVSVLCANAGFATCGPLSEADPAREAAAVEVNVHAPHELALAVLPGMLARRAGAILITGSNAGEQPVPTAATYAACKAFANAFAEALHAELAGTGVSCTLLEPGPVRTEFARVGGVTHLEQKRWIRWMDCERVALDALDALQNERRSTIPGVAAKAQALAGRHAPRALLFPLLRSVVLPAMRR
jgi:short-subunit dehydrogenase